MSGSAAISQAANRELENVRHRDISTRIILLSVLIASVPILLFSTAASLISIWKFGTYSHGFVILPISLWLVYTRRERLRSVSLETNSKVLILLAGLEIVWLVGVAARVNVLPQFALLAMLPTFVWLLFGSNAVRVLAFPLVFVLFATPIGDGLIGPMQDLTSRLVVHGLEWTGVPVLQEGRQITIPSGVWIVAEACSGVRYLISTIVLGLLFAFMVYRSWKKRLLFMAVCLVAPIIANGMRAYAIIMIAHLSDRKLAVGVDHLIFGWVFFLFIISVLFWFGWKWHDNDDFEPEPSSAMYFHSNAPELSSSKAYLATVSALIIVAAGPLLARSSKQQVRLPLKDGIAAEVKSPWEQVASPSVWKPEMKDRDLEIQHTYRSNGHKVYLYASLYQDQLRSGQLVSELNQLYNPHEWVQVSVSNSIANIGNKRVRVSETVIKSPQQRLRVWSLYWVAGRLTANAYAAKALEAGTVLFHRPQQAAMVAVATDDGDSASSVLSDFMSHLDLPEALQESVN